MALVANNLLTQGLSGTFAKQVTFRQIGGKTFASKAQKPRTVPPTEKEIAARRNFAEATAYAKNTIRDPAIKALYQSVVKGGQRAFNIMIMDALNPPVVEKISAEFYRGVSGDYIQIFATDDFKVARVKVAIHDVSGKVIESGEAVPGSAEKEWNYLATQTNPHPTGSGIVVTAMDLPGNKAEMAIILE